MQCKDSIRLQCAFLLLLLFFYCISTERSTKGEDSSIYSVSAYLIYIVFSYTIFFYKPELNIIAVMQSKFKKFWFTNLPIDCDYVYMRSIILVHALPLHNIELYYFLQSCRSFDTAKILFFFLLICSIFSKIIQGGAFYDAKSSL